MTPSDVRPRQMRWGFLFLLLALALLALEAWGIRSSIAALLR